MCQHADHLHSGRTRITNGQLVRIVVCDHGCGEVRVLGGEPYSPAFCADPPEHEHLTNAV